jgi:hypothetical protein
MTNSLLHFVTALPDKLREEDKLQHMRWSFFLMLVALALLPTYFAFSAVFLIGLAKECWDFKYGSGFCLFDMTGNLIGTLGGLLFGFMVSFLF